MRVNNNLGDAAMCPLFFTFAPKELKMLVDHIVLESNGIIIDKNKYSIIVNGKEVYLTKILFELLHFLALHPDKIISRDDLLNYVWENEFIGDRTVDVHIKKLRDVIGKEYITTIRNVGYIWKSN